MAVKHLSDLNMEGTGRLVRALHNPVASDPSSPADGEIWLNTTSDQLKAQVNGSTVVLATLDDITAGAINGSLWDAQSVIIAVADDTPVAETLAASTVLGRRASGNIGAVTYANLKADLQALGIDATTLDGIDSSGFATAGHDHSGTYQPLDSDLTAIAALTTTAFGRALLTEASAAALRATLSLEPGTDVQAYSAVLAATTAAFTTALNSKLANITVTQAVDLDQLETDVAALANGVKFVGGWDASGGSFPSGADTGDMYRVTTGGTVNSVEFNVGDALTAITDGASTTTYANNWLHTDSTDAVQSVAGKVGAITLVKADITDADWYEPGGTDVPIADGGTGASTAAAARTNLGLAIGTNVQAYSAVLAATTASFTTALKTKLDAIDQHKANIGNGSSTSIAVTHNLGTTDVMVQVFEVATGETVICDVVRTNANVVTFGFSTAPASNALRVLITKVP